MSESREVPTASARQRRSQTTVAELETRENEIELLPSSSDVLEGEESEQEFDLGSGSNSESDNESRAGSGRGRGRGRTRTVGPAKPDVSGLTDAEAEEALAAWKKEKNRLAAARFRANLKAMKSQIKDPYVPEMTKLIELRKENGALFRGWLAVGKEYREKAELQHKIQAAAEALYITVKFPGNSNTSIIAEPGETSSLTSADFKIVARWRSKKKSWVITESVIRDRVGTLQKHPGEKISAYSEETLAHHVKQHVRDNPNIDSKVLVGLLREFVNHEELLTKTVSRIRNRAADMVFGSPNENIKLLPRLKAVFQTHGHLLEYGTVDCHTMKKIVLSVAKAEHEQNAKAAKMVPAGRRTEEQSTSLESWDLIARQKWIEKHKDLIHNLESNAQRFVESAFISFKDSLTTYEKLLPLFNLDAAHCKHGLKQYQLFTVTGFNSNFNIVPICYAFIAGNESCQTWGRVLDFLKRHFPGIAQMDGVTFTSNEQKGLIRALEEAYPDVPHFCCYSYRKNTIAQHGKPALELLKKLVYASSIEEVNQLRNSPEYRKLSDAAKGAIEKVHDKHQILIVANMHGAKTYGRPTSQAVESQNNAVCHARCVDLVTSILMLTEMQMKQFEANYIEAHTLYNRGITTYASKSLNNLMSSGNVRSVPEESNTEKFIFIVDTETNQYKVALHVADGVENAEGDNLADDEDFDDVCCFGECSCGAPQRDHFPCVHMVRVAETISRRLSELVPLEFRVRRWRSQYPIDLEMSVPTIEDLKANPLPLDESLAVAITAPPKTGRPHTKRLRSAIEIAIKRHRSSNTP